MTQNPEKRNVLLFVLISYVFSWPIFFCVDGWLEPTFTAQGNEAAARLSVLIGHTVAMLGPALAALLLWRFRHKEAPAWSWSRLRYYGIVALAMLALWTLPGLIGLLSGDTLQSPVETEIWIRIAIMGVFGWVSGIGEETGWCAYLLPRLSPQVGKPRAMLVSGAIRGLWHWPVLVAPVIGQVIAGEHTWLELLGAGVVIAIQLVIGNVLFGSILGWVWYRTESIPLVGWAHFWHNLTRDVTLMLLVGYGDSLWAALMPIALYVFAFVLFDRVRRDEGLEWWQVFGSSKEEPSEQGVEADDLGSGTRIVLARRSMLADKLQPYVVLVDGEEVAQIRDGEMRAVPVSPGSHVVQLKMDWCRSEPAEFSVSEGEGVRFECGSSLGGWRIILAPIYLTILRNRSLWIRSQE